MKALLCIVVILTFLFMYTEDVQGHAILIQPRPWWDGPSRERPCGGGQFNPLPAIWEMGETQTLKWSVVALDGNGEVHGRIDTEGQVNFNTARAGVKNLTIKNPEGGIKSQGLHYLTLTVPAVNCTGPNKTCTIQLWTNNGGGWYTCLTVNITCKGCRPSAPLPADDNCLQAPKNLSFCGYKSDTQIKIARGTNATYIDRLVNGTYVLNQPNPNVFVNGTTEACRANYKRLICEYYMPPCGNTSATFSRQVCNKVLWEECGMTEAHRWIYDCLLFRDVNEIHVPYLPYVPKAQSSNSSQSVNASAPSQSANSSAYDAFVPPDYFVPSRDYDSYVPPAVYSPSDAYVPPGVYDPYVPPTNSSSNSSYVPPSTPSPYWPPSFPSSSKSSTTKSSTTKASSNSTTIGGTGSSNSTTGSATNIGTSTTKVSSTTSTTKASTGTTTAASTTKASTGSTTATSTTKASTGTTTAASTGTTTAASTSTTKASSTSAPTTSTTKASSTSAPTTSTTKTSTGATTAASTSTTKASSTSAPTTSTTKASSTSTTKASSTSTTKASTSATTA